MSLTIDKAVEIINNKQGTRETIAKEMGISANTLTRRIKSGGYEYSQKKKKYILTSPNPGDQEGSNTEKKQDGNPKNNMDGNQESKQSNKQNEIQSNKTDIKKIKKVTYEIDEDVHFELRMTAFKEKRNVSELVEQALKEYLANHY